MKKRSITIYVLCHAHINLALRALKSINDQLDPGFDITPIIMMNTNDPSLVQKMRDNLPEPKKTRVIHSWSNGMPGKGKNACIMNWEMDTTGYMMIIDGDDWLYPHALWYISEFIKKIKIDVDYLGLQTLDVIYDHKVNPQAMQISKDPLLYLNSWGERQINMTEYRPRLMWIKNITKFHSVDRNVLLRRGAEIIYYPEDMFCYEDMVYNVKLLELMDAGWAYCHINTSGIYIADGTVKGAQQHLHTIDHQTPYEGHVRPIVERTGNLNFNEIPFYTVKQHPTLNIINKIDYITKTYNYETKSETQIDEGI